MAYDLGTFDVTVPPRIQALLADADAAYSDPGRAERAFQAALAEAPDNLGLRIATYTFYFYANRLAEALPHAEACLVLTARTLGVAEDWRQVGPGDAAFTGFEGPQRTYLKTLVAIGYCRARLGDLDGAKAILRHAACLDPEDRVNAARLADLVARGGLDPDDDED